MRVLFWWVETTTFSFDNGFPGSPPQPHPNWIGFACHQNKRTPENQNDPSLSPPAISKHFPRGAGPLSPLPPCFSHGLDLRLTDGQTPQPRQLSYTESTDHNPPAISPSSPAARRGETAFLVPPSYQAQLHGNLSIAHVVGLPMLELFTSSVLPPSQPISSASPNQPVN